MNRVRKYAIWAHQELIAKIHSRIQTLRISSSVDAEAIAKQYFIRICALRFMEVNDLVYNRMRIFSVQNGGFQPQLIVDYLESIHALDCPLEDLGQASDLSRVLFIALCNGLHSQLPNVFPKMDEVTESLIPDDIISFGGIIDRLVSDIQEEAFDIVHGFGVEIVGWLYQYFISETREEIIDPLYKKYITKKDIPTATQVFTPDWIVQYIVDNSLGRFWIEHHPNSRLAEQLDYYISECKKCQKPVTSQEDTSVKSDCKSRDCREITVLDPCVGAGHFLVYAIDVLMHIYCENGFSKQDAIRDIIRYNIYGLDIEECVVQQSRFAVMMKGCQYDPEFLSQGITPQIYQIQDLGHINTSFIDSLFDGDKELKEKIHLIFNTMKDAGGLGSIIQISAISEVLQLLNRFKAKCVEKMPELENDINVIRLLTSQYDIVITNPPYLNKYDDILKLFIQKHYKEYSGDLFSVFIYRCLQFCKPNGYAGLMTPNVWMFIKSYEKLRRYILEHHSITTLVQLAKGSFFNDATVDVCAFVMQSQKIGIMGSYFRLENFQGNMKIQRQKLVEAIQSSACAYRYAASSELFKSLPGLQIGYWIGKAIIHAFQIGKPLNKIALPRQGLATTDNNKYLRHWFEVSIHDIGFGLDRKTAISSDIKWFPYNKGGEFRKWYGNQDYIVNYRNDGEEIKCDVMRKYPYLKSPNFVVKNPDTYFSPSLSWSKISSGSVAFRYFPQGFLYDVSGCSVFFKRQTDLYLYAGFLNSIVSKQILEIISPTLNYEAGHISSLPILDFEKYRDRIQNIVEENIALSHEDWDQSETSWGFRHSIVSHCKKSVLLEKQYKILKEECDNRFNQLKANEEELNRIFIDIYGLQGELTPKVNDKDVTVRKADLLREVKSLISYAVGCMFGRYSLDREGLCYAGGNFADQFVTTDTRCYLREVVDRVNGEVLSSNHFGAVADNIIPITDDEYFADDIVSRFVEFVRIAYGADTLEENLRYIADTLGGKGCSRDVIRAYFLNDFYAEHVKAYQKRPIYWLFSSGKKNGFKCLIYMHRYQQDTIARIRTDYIHELQSQYLTVISGIDDRLKTVTGSEAVSLKKHLKKLNEQTEELFKYEEKIHHLADHMISIDLDDGVKLNYAKFGEVLQTI